MMLQERDEVNRVPNYEVELIAPDGLGYGNGAVGVQNRLAPESPDNKRPITEQTMQVVGEALNSDSVVVPLGKDGQGRTVRDDGCGDGRHVNRIMMGSEEKLVSLFRSKVFGGGATMNVAARIGIGKAETELQSEFDASITDLVEFEGDDGEGLDFGAHIDTHAHGPNCGCGAIDKAPEVVRSVAENRENIAGSVRALFGALGRDLDEEKLASVLDSYANYAANLPDQQYSGKDVMNRILDEEKVVKELDNDHFEVAIVVNTIEGHTIDQSVVREATGDDGQVFVLDDWRIKEIADRRYGASGEADEAYIGMWVYTFGVAAVLTKGDLPVYAVKQS